MCWVGLGRYIIFGCWVEFSFLSFIVSLLLLVTNNHLVVVVVSSDGYCRVQLVFTYAHRHAHTHVSI